MSAAVRSGRPGRTQPTAQAGSRGCESRGWGRTAEREEKPRVKRRRVHREAASGLPSLSLTGFLGGSCPLSSWVPTLSQRLACGDLTVG